MTKFNSREIAAISILGASWAIINATLSPVFWQLTHLPLLCDMLAFISLILASWWTKRFGAATATGVVASVLSIILRPSATQMLAFAAASFVFDLLTRGMGYENCFSKEPYGSLMLVGVSTVSAGVAGSITGSIFMGIPPVSPLLFFTGLHAAGGAIGGSLGVVLMRALSARGLRQP